MTPAFAVASMVAAYASASSTATPRSFPLILGDDVSQNALSAFTGAFIYSVVALVALMNGLYGGRASQFILFSLTIVVLAVVLFMFIRWVDNIARLGRLGHTIDTVEAAAAEAIRRRQFCRGGVARHLLHAKPPCRVGHPGGLGPCVRRGRRSNRCDVPDWRLEGL